ncbi:MAG: DNA adenine methylase [Alkalispirochaeta sp.]
MANSSTTFKPKWNSGKTKVIRVPEALSGKVLDFARFLDTHDGHDAAEPTQLYLEGTAQIDTRKPINISKIVHRSPFRYPGGKTWFVPYLRRWLMSFESQHQMFVEPFAGGAICSLTVAFEEWAKHVVFAELDDRVAAVWHTILQGNAEWLSQQILDFSLTKEHVVNALETEDGASTITLKDKAFLAILRNRVQRGGIMAPGAGLVKNGENGKGLKSRWYPETLARRIRDIDSIRDRITFEHVDGFRLIERYHDDSDVLFFADPPYTKAARRLYQFWQFDHRKLFEAFSTIAGHFLLTYDNTEEIRSLAAEYGFQTEEITMKNTHHTEMTELLIGNDLSWLHEET